MKGIFLKAAVVAIALFALSLYVGYSLENNSYGSLDAKLNEMQDGMENSLLFSMFLQTHNRTDQLCVVMRDQLDITAQEAYNIYGALEESKSTSIFKGYDQLRKRYFMANMRFYLMLRSYQQQCGDSSLKPVLFFYSTYNDCPECVAQGKTLDAVRYECKNARVYAFPGDAGDIPMVKAFKSYYGIDKTPSLVINDQRYDNLMGKYEIKAKIGCND